MCAQGVRCVFRNSTCPPVGEPCRYGTVNVTTALAVSSDTFFYKLGEEFYNTPGTQLQDNVRLFGFGADTGIDLPFEFDGRVPTNELKAQLVEDGVLAEGETPNLQPGDLLQMAIGQGLMAATPLQLAVGYGAFANGGCRAHAPRGAGDLRPRDARRRPRLRRPLAGHDRPADRPAEPPDRR